MIGAMTVQHSLSSCFLKTFAPPKHAVWLHVCSKHLCVGEVDISPQGELSNLRVYMKSFITMICCTLKMINSPFGEKILIGQSIRNKRNKCP